ncbi:MAG TPA: hypothetical protein VME43_21780 [Bryobacteraceae bacterium]|nr:hypothetical protein [Bryobacteraceae bacterium]
MSSSLTLSTSASLMVPSQEARRPQNVAEAAQQFEALMIGELLKAARGDENGWLGSGEDTGDATAGALAEEQFAQALARSGGLGLGKLIEANLAPDRT